LVIIFILTGASGFVSRFNLPYPSAKYLRWIEFGDEGFLAVAKRDCVAIFKAVTIGNYIRD